MRLKLVPVLVVVALAGGTPASAQDADTTEPTITLTTPPDGAVYDQFETVAADYSCADEPGGSGLRPNDNPFTAGCYGFPGVPPVLGAADGQHIDTTTPGEHSFTVTARDNAGNEASVTHAYEVIADTTPPVVTFTTPPDGAVYTRHQSVTYDFSCTDSGSGILPPGLPNPFLPVPGCYVATGDFGQNPGSGAFVNTFLLGPRTVHVHGEDRAGNETNVTHTYTVVEPAEESDYAGLVASDDPAGHWRLGELSGTTAVDASPNANHGTYVGGVSLGAMGALVGDPDTAASFDGVDDTVRVPDHATLDVGSSFTAEGWVRRSAASRTHALVNKGSRGLQLVVMGAASGNEIWLRKGGITTIARSSVGVPADGAYHHVAATMSGAGTARIYLDGADVTVPVSGQHVQVVENTAFPLHFGSGASTEARYDEFALYDEALTPADVVAHHAAGVGGVGS